MFDRHWKNQESMLGYSVSSRNAELEKPNVRAFGRVIAGQTHEQSLTALL